MKFPKTTTLTLSKLTSTKGTSGGQVQAWSTVQTLGGSLQPINAVERSQWEKETTTVDWKFFVSESEFTSDANETELKETNRLIQTTPSRTLDIIGVENWTETGGYYKVFLQEKK
jgi:head-tail adaptor